MFFYLILKFQILSICVFYNTHDTREQINEEIFLYFNGKYLSFQKPFVPEPRDFYLLIQSILPLVQYSTCSLVNRSNSFYYHSLRSISSHLHFIMMIHAFLDTAHSINWLSYSTKIYFHHIIRNV